MRFAFLLAVSGAVQGAGSEAWWDICDSCYSDSDFSSRAVQIPQPYERVYISNSQTNETRRFQRSFIVDDLWGDQSLTIIANEEALTAQEAQAFEETIQGADALQIGISRDTLDGYSGLSGRDSVVGDLATGSLSDGLLTGIQTYVRSQGYAGSASDVEAETEVDTLILSFNLTINLDDLRTEPLVVRITYPDGSRLQIKLAKDLTEVLSISGTDAEGNEIKFDQNDSDFPVTPTPGAEYSFVTLNPGWANQFLQSLDAVDSYTCSATWVADDYVVVLCQRL